MNAALLNLLAADLRGQKGVRAKRRCGEPFDPWCHPRLAGLGISWKAQMATVNWTESRDAQWWRPLPHGIVGRKEKRVG